MACHLRRFRKETLYPHKRSEGLRQCLRLERIMENNMKNSNAKKAPAKLPTRAYVGDPIFSSPTTHQAKGCKPSQKMPANSGVKKA